MLSAMVGPIPSIAVSSSWLVASIAPTLPNFLARILATYSPTWRMPRANSRRSSGGCFERVIAWMRLSADLSAKRSRSRSRSFVMPYRSAGSWISPASSNWLTILSPSPSMSMPPRETKCLMFSRIGAGQIDAAVGHLALEPHDPRAADGAGRWHPEGSLFSGPPAFDDLDDLGDHVARPLHDHGVADADVLLGDLVFVVQGCPAHRDAAHLDGFHDGNGGQHARSPHTDDDVLDDGRCLRGREFDRHGPARASGHHPQAVLEGKRIDLEDDPIDLVGELLPDGFDVTIVADASLNVAGKADVGVGRESPIVQRLQGVPVGRKAP